MPFYLIPYSYFLTIWYLSYFLVGWNMPSLWGSFCFYASRQKDPEKLALLLLSVLLVFLISKLASILALRSAFIGCFGLPSLNLSSLFCWGYCFALDLDETTAYKFRPLLSLICQHIYSLLKSKVSSYRSF